MCLTAPTSQIALVGPYQSLRNTSQLDCVYVNEHEEGLVLSSKMIERGRARPAAPPSGLPRRNRPHPPLSGGTRFST